MAVASGQGMSKNVHGGHRGSRRECEGDERRADPGGHDAC